MTTTQIAKTHLTGKNGHHTHAEDFESAKKKLNAPLRRKVITVLNAISNIKHVHKPTRDEFAREFKNAVIGIVNAKNSSLLGMFCTLTEKLAKDASQGHEGLFNAFRKIRKDLGKDGCIMGAFDDLRDFERSIKGTNGHSKNGVPLTEENIGKLPIKKQQEIPD